VLSVTLAGSAEFTIITNTCNQTSLKPGKSCTVTVRFASASAGTVTTTLTVANNKQTVLATDALTGTGVPVGHIYWGNNTRSDQRPGYGSPRAIAGQHHGGDPDMPASP
jgi:hypothetical protein